VFRVSGFYDISMADWRAPPVARTPEERGHLAERLETLLSTLAAGIVEVDLEGRFVFANPAAERMLGMTETAYLGRTPDELGIVRYDTAGRRVDPSESPILTAGRGGRERIRSVYRYSGLSVPDLWLEGETAPIFSVTGALVGAVVSFVDVTARFALEAVQRAADQRLDDILRHTAVGVLMVDAGGRIEYANAAALGGRQASDVLGQLAADPAWQIMNEDAEVLPYHALPVPTALREKREVRDMTLGFPFPGGETRWARVTVVPLSRADGSLRGAVVTLDDTTERRALAAQLAQAQKMDAIGQLAGGIAHDFNNLLTSILGSAELAMMAAPADSGLVQDLSDIRKAALRGAALTGRVLTFARKQVPQPRSVSLERLVDSTQKLLEGALGEQIVLRRESDANLWSARVNPSEMEQVIINLAINARDAMPGGGELIIGTHNRVVDPAQAGQRGVDPGEYVALSLRDTGVGIPPELLGRIFEPFFTTKPVGKGTGLGLAICYGVANQSHGFITAESTLGRGSTFTVYLPRAPGGAPSPASGDDDPTPLAKGTGIIMVVEDEEGVRKLIARILGEAGYQVLSAASGVEALAIQRRTPHKIEVLVADVIMPNMRGPDVARAMRQHQPNLPVLFVTGYTGFPLAETPGFGPEDEVLGKPFAPQQLLACVRYAITRDRP
jgi:two-component system, cell cycle sensor histidine kinase and response regulator CckA